MHLSDKQSTIELWADAVTAAAFPIDPGASPPDVKYFPSRHRHPLLPTTLNPRLGKREFALSTTRLNPTRACKRVKAMANRSPNDEMTVEAADTAPPRGRGRGRGRPRSRAGHARVTNQGRGQGGCPSQDLSVIPPSVVFDTPLSNPVYRPKSPAKSRSKIFEKAKADANIDMKFLESCKPSVHLRTRMEAIQSGEVPQMVRDLESSLRARPVGFVPSTLKSAYDHESDTPRKSRLPPESHHYLPLDDTKIPSSCVQALKTTVDQVVRMTAWNLKVEAHERQWSMTTVSPLISEVLRWPQSSQAIAINVETCPVEPTNIRMVRPNGHPVDETGSAAASSNVSVEDAEVTTTRIVDICLGLDLSPAASSIVTNAWKTMNDYEHSLNQSVAYIRQTPLFLDIEL
ncbi:MAG: hypothetical protein Q9178_004734 [Gyalolechia marmorata]